MNILNINGEDTCGISKMLCDYINKETKHNARCFIRSMNVREYPYDLWWNINCNENKLREMIEWADILHFNIWPPSVGFGKVDFRPYIENEDKKVIMQFHGTAFRRTPPIRQEVEENGYKTLVMMPIMFDYINDELCKTEWLPFPIPTDKPEFMPVPDEDKFQQFAVAHSPGEVHRWEIKDTDLILQVADNMNEVIEKVWKPNKQHVAGTNTDTDYLVKTVQVINSKSTRYTRLELMSKTPWEECIKIKQRCHVGFDHLQGYYGVNTAEFMSMGIPAICNPNYQYYKYAMDRYGKEPPFVISDRVILEDTIRALRDDAELRHEIGGQSRDYAVKVHDIESSVLPQLIHAYKEVMKG